MYMHGRVSEAIRSDRCKVSLTNIICMYQTKTFVVTNVPSRLLLLLTLAHISFSLAVSLLIAQAFQLNIYFISVVNNHHHNSQLIKKY